MEKLLQYIWQYRLLPPAGKTVDGEDLSIIDPGLLNNDSGPDFFNAKVQIGGRIWCGNVEIHVKASDWLRHGHQNDGSYDSVILHVVRESDTRIKRPDGTLIPQFKISCRSDFNESYRSLVCRADGNLPCSSFIPSLHPVYLSDWMTSLAYERLSDKARDIMNYYRRFNGDWQNVIYVTLARALGFHTNSQPFELLALATPLKYLLYHRDSPQSVEGLLFGQAGMLQELPESYVKANPYVGEMIREYEFLSHKFSLVRPTGICWKLARMRPANFPHRRIATLAALVEEGFDIADRIFAVSSVEEAVRLFDFELRGFWSRRYSFSSETARGTAAMSRASAMILTVNVVIPLLYVYGETTGRQALMGRAVDMLQEAPAESNKIISIFNEAGVKSENAFDTQAILQLWNNYCSARKCIYCRIGHKFLREKAVNTGRDACANSER